MTQPEMMNASELEKHSQLLLSSYRLVTGKELIDLSGTGKPVWQALFDAPFALLSHNTEADPIFNYGNRTALELFELSWDELIRLPSRKSAEPVNREERAGLLERVTRDGFIDDYSGVRISSTGRRFRIHHATVWNIIDEQSVYRGQAAMFADWQESGLTD